MCFPKVQKKFSLSELAVFFFLDTMSFLKDSLANLASNLRERGSHFPVMRENLCMMGEHFDVDKYNFVNGKMIFPYGYLKEENLDNGFPSQDEFFNELTETRITRNEYKNAHALYKKFQCNTRKIQGNISSWMLCSLLISGLAMPMK